MQYKCFKRASNCILISLSITKSAHNCSVHIKLFLPKTHPFGYEETCNLVSKMVIFDVKKKEETWRRRDKEKCRTSSMEEEVKKKLSYWLRTSVPVHNPASKAGPPSLTCLTNMVSIGSKRFLCFPEGRTKTKAWTYFTTFY